MPTRRPSTMHLAATTLALGLLLPVSGSAQVSLGTPTARFPEDFGSIQTVRELPDGRVLVADPLGKALYTVDLDAGRRTTVGGLGEGPGEYLQPDAVWPLPADSTLLVDLGNGRLVALAPDLSFGPTMPIGPGDFQPGVPLALALPQGIDGRGRIYSRLLGGGMGQELPDSAEIVRIDRGSRAREAVARFKLPDRTQTTSGGANSRSVQISDVPLSQQDAWGVAPDGAVAIARAGEYRVDWVMPDGSRVRGQVQSYDPVSIGTAKKEEWVTEQGRSGGGIQVGVSVSNGQMAMSFARGGAAARPREIDNYQWPDRAPAFQEGRLLIDPSGRAWVRRHVRAGQPTLYDVFDRRGARVGSVTLDAGKRILGFGDGSVYVVTFDEFDLSYLERYRMPVL